MISFHKLKNLIQKFFSALFFTFSINFFCIFFSFLEILKFSIFKISISHDSHPNFFDYQVCKT